MKYFVWDVYFPGDRFAYCDKLKGIDDSNIILLLSGKKLEVLLPEFSAESFTAGSLGDIFGCAFGIVVSEKVKKIIEDNNIQFIPLKIPTTDLKYYFANFLSVFEGIDKEKSLIKYFDTDPDNIEKIKKLVLLQGVAESVGVFRLSERPDVIIVSEKLKKRLQQISKSAGIFTPLEKFKIGYF